MKKSVLAIALFGAAFAHADYQFEAGAFVGQGDISQGNNEVDFDAFGVLGALHFAPVDTSKGPLAEAAFLSRSSSINFGFTSIEPDFDNADDLDTFSFGGRAVTAQNVILEAGYSTTEYGDEESDSVRIGAGTYLTPNADVVVSYQTSDDDNVDEDRLGVDFHGVNSLMQGASFAYDLSLAYIDGDSDNGHAIGVGGTYYFNPAFGIGLSAELEEVGDIDSDTVTLDLSYFPQANLQLVAAYFDQDAVLETEGVLIGASLRF